MNSQTFNLLSFLEPFGVGVQTNISSLLIRDYPQVDTMSQELWVAIQEINLRLISLEKAGLIFRGSDLKLRPGNLSNGPQWLNNTPVMVTLTQDGEKVLLKEKSKGFEERMMQSIIDSNESNIQTNNATFKNYRLQKRLSILTIMVAAISTFFIIMTTIDQCNKKTTTKLEEIKKSIDSLRVKSNRQEGHPAEVGVSYVGARYFVPFILK